MRLNILQSTGEAPMTKNYLSQRVAVLRWRNPTSGKEHTGDSYSRGRRLRQEAGRSFPNCNSKPDLVVNKGEPGRGICHTPCSCFPEWSHFTPGRDLGQTPQPFPMRRFRGGLRP